jgi:hypothetical protein
VPTLWRVDPRTLAVTRHELKLESDNDKDVGFVDLAWEEKQGAYFAASTADGALWRIDRDLKAARKVAPRAGRTCAAHLDNYCRGLPPPSPRSPRPAATSSGRPRTPGRPRCAVPSACTSGLMRASRRSRARTA